MTVSPRRHLTYMTALRIPAHAACISMMQPGFAQERVEDLEGPNEVRCCANLRTRSEDCRKRQNHLASSG